MSVKLSKCLLAWKKILTLTGWTIELAPEESCMATGGCYSIYIQAQLSLNLKVCHALIQRKQKGNYTSCLISLDQQTAQYQGTECDD